MISSQSSTSIDHTGRWLLLATVTASGMGFIAQSALNPALPVIQTDLEASGADLLWIVNAYQLLLGALILVGGSLGDHFGRKRIYMLGIVVFGAASLLCGIAPNTQSMIGARLLQGIGGALMIPGSLAMIAAYFEGRARGQAIGIWSSFSTMMSLAGPILGGWLAGAGLWRGVFFINLPLAVVSLVILLLFVPESKDEEMPPGLDYLGALLITLGLAGIVYGFTEIGREGLRDGLGDSTNLLALFGGIGMLIAFLRVEATSKHPLMPLHLFNSRTFSGANLLTLLLYGALACELFFVPLNLIQVQGYTPLAAGVATLPITILLILMSPWAGGLVERIGPRLPLIFGPVIVGVGFLGLSLPGIPDVSSYVALPAIDALGLSETRILPTSYFTSFFPALVVFGIGLGITVAPLTTTVMGSVPKHNAGVASGINNAVSRASGVLAIAVMGGITLIVFSIILNGKVDALDLPESARTQLEAEAANLANATVPEQLDAEQAAAVQRAIDESFVNTFKVIMLICAGLSIKAGLLAALFVEPRLPDPDGNAGAAD